MVKKGYIECPKCNRSFKGNKSFSRHKCDTKPIKEQKKTCPICKVVKQTQNYRKHYDYCESKKFLLTFGQFIYFLFKIITSYNRTLKKFNYIGDKDEQKIIIYNEKDPDNTKNLNYKEKIKTINLKNQRIHLNEIMENRYDNEKSIVNELSNNSKNKEFIPVVMEIKQRFFPGFSIREIVSRYLNDEEIDNKKIMKRLNVKYKYRDYPTDSEIRNQSEELYNDLITLRGNYPKWKHQFDKFFFMLKEYKNNNNSYRCSYCHKFVYSEKRHLINCDEGKTSFILNRDKFIKSYLIKYYNFDKMSQGKEWTIMTKSEGLNYEEFLTQFPKILKTRSKIIKELESEKLGLLPEMINDNNDTKEKKETKEERIERIKKKKEMLQRKLTSYWGKSILKEVNEEFDRDKDKPIEEPKEEEIEIEDDNNDDDFQHIRNQINEFENEGDDEPDKSSEDEESKSQLDKLTIQNTGTLIYNFKPSKQVGNIQFITNINNDK